MVCDDHLYSITTLETLWMAVGYHLALPYSMVLGSSSISSWAL